MTREEEIKLVAECAVTDEKYKEFKEGLIWGAKWADTNPKKGMINIDKACEWLWDEIYERIDDPRIKESLCEDNYRANLVSAFREAMDG